LSRPFVLIISTADDPSSKQLQMELTSRGVRFAVVAPNSFPETTFATCAISEGETCFSIADGEVDIALCDITSVYYWHPTPPTAEVKGRDASTVSFIEEEWHWFAHGLWRLMNCFWMSHPRAVKEASYKPRQLQLALECGFKIPPTLVSNDPQKIARFFTAHSGDVIHKAIYGSSFAKRGLRKLPIYTQLVPREALRDLASLSQCPVIYQPRIPKRYDIRVTVVGDEVFPAEIHSQESEMSKLDFRRYDFENTPYKVHELPRAIGDGCRLMMKSFGLNYGAFDFILTPEGEYIFLEVNPSGQYGWIEGLTGMKINDAICDLLIATDRPVPSGSCS